MEDDKDRLFVTALARGLKGLAAFRPGEASLSNQELAKRTGLPKSTVSRLTYTLTKQGYLSQDADSGFYRLGVAVLELGAAVLASYDIRHIAGPLMREFALANNVSISLATRDGTDMVYLETCRSQAKVSVQLTVGSRVPIATTAIGRAYYLGLAETEREHLDAQLAERYGKQWPTLQQQLQREQANYQQRGFSVSFGEYEQDVMAVGVHLPSLSASQPAMSLNASGPAFAFSADTMQNVIAPALLALRQRLVPRG